MKTTRLLLASLLLLSGLVAADEAAPAAAEPEALIFSQGSRLIYKLSNGGTLLIAIDSFPARAGPVKFRYLFSDLGPSGTVTLTKEALQSATALHNYFENGELTLTDKTSVWVSQKVFADAKAGRPVQLDLGEDGTVVFKLDEEGGGFMPLSIDAARYGDLGAIGTILLRSADGMKTIRIKDDADAPLIVDLDTGSFRATLSLHL